jgi:hypothetical protein
VTNPAYKWYGARGIKVYARWQNSFPNFLADMGSRPLNKSLERRNNDGDYTPENCYWATTIEQGRNRRDNHLFTFSGKTQCMAAWAEELGMHPQTLNSRVVRKWSVERMLTQPVRRY